MVHLVYSQVNCSNVKHELACLGIMIHDSANYVRGKEGERKEREVTTFCLEAF